MSSVGSESSHGSERRDQIAQAMRHASIADHLNEDGFEYFEPGTFHKEEGLAVERLWGPQREGKLFHWASGVKSIRLIHASNISTDENGRNPSYAFLYSYYAHGIKHPKLRFMVVRFVSMKHPRSENEFDDMIVDSYLDVYGKTYPVLLAIYKKNWETFFHEDYQYEFVAKKSFNFHLRKYEMPIRSVVAHNIKKTFRKLDTTLNL